MPSFRSLSPSLRPASRGKADEPPAPPDNHRPVSGALVDCGVYVDGARLPGLYSHAQACAKVRELEEIGQDAFVWIGLHEPDESQMKDLTEVFGLHPLAIEDAVSAHQRPKLERYDESLFLVLKTVNYVPHESVVLAREIVETGEIMIFVNTAACPRYASGWRPTRNRCGWVRTR